MDLNWLETILYGLISGLAEILPVSIQAHQTLLLRVFGANGAGGFLQLAVHLGMLIGLCSAISMHLSALHREMKLSAIPKRRRKRHPDVRSMLDIQLIRTAFFPMLIGFMFYPKTSTWNDQLHIVALFLLINGIFLYIPQLFRSGNKDSRSMARLDGVLLGIGGALSVIPGLSQMAVCTSMTTMRGADRQNTLNWAFMLTIPAIVFLLGFDVYSIIQTGMGISGVVDIVICLFGGIAAYFGAYAGVAFMKYLAVNIGFSGFAYYSWGAALFTFILYLTVS